MGVIDALATWSTSVENLLIEWEHLGIFEYILPFLLIFAVVFGILTKSEVLGTNRGVNTVISLAVGLLAMQSYVLRSFFRTIFPYAGIGIAILLVGLILIHTQTTFITSSDLHESGCMHWLNNFLGG